LDTRQDTIRSHWPTSDDDGGGGGGGGGELIEHDI